MRMFDRLRGLDDERGTTMIELAVTMGLMSVFMAIFTTAILAITKTTAKVEAVAVSSAQSNYAFLKLDKSIRYANAISVPQPDPSAQMWHVEWDSTTITRTSSAAVNTESCTQLRIDPGSKRLQMRTWTVTSNGASYSGLSSWTTLASGITNGTTTTKDGTTDPFIIPPQSGSASAGLQQLQLNLVTSSSTSTSASTGTSYTFTAVNSAGVGTTNTNVCKQVSVGATS